MRNDGIDQALAGNGRRGTQWRRIALVLAALGLAFAACGNDRVTDPLRRDRQVTVTTAAPSSSATPATATAATVTGSAVEPTRPLSVRSDHDLVVFTRPEAEPLNVLWARNQFGSPLALLVAHLGAGAWEDWYEVLLPGRPNGRTAWVRAQDVTLHEVDHEVEVDLASRTLRVLERGKEVLVTPVAVGSPESPTPTGRFSLTDKLDTGRPDGPYGPFALGLSARSDALTEFAGGDAQVGIHGTNVPSSIGQPVSHGCIRVPNEVAVQLSRMLALGTPVTVR